MPYPDVQQQTATHLCTRNALRRQHTHAIDAATAPHCTVVVVWLPAQHLGFGFLAQSVQSRRVAIEQLSLVLRWQVRHYPFKRIAAGATATQRNRPSGRNQHQHHRHQQTTSVEVQPPHIFAGKRLTTGHRMSKRTYRRGNCCRTCSGQHRALLEGKEVPRPPELFSHLFRAGRCRSFLSQSENLSLTHVSHSRSKIMLGCANQGNVCFAASPCSDSARA